MGRDRLDEGFALLQALIANPYGDIRYVFADWVEEFGLLYFEKGFYRPMAAHIVADILEILRKHGYFMNVFMNRVGIPVLETTIPSGPRKWVLGYWPVTGVIHGDGGGPWGRVLGG